MKLLFFSLLFYNIEVTFQGELWEHQENSCQIDSLALLVLHFLHLHFTLHRLLILGMFSGLFTVRKGWSCISSMAEISL